MDRFAMMTSLIRVIETGSFSGAARQLRVGQPAVSKSIAQLEEYLGVRLLLRSTHGLTPTEAGQSFYEHAKRAIEQANEAELAARGAGATLSGRLRVSAAVTFARLHIVPRMNPFLTAHPDLEIELVLDDRNVDLMQEGIDVALRMGELADSGAVARKVGTGERIVVGTPEYFHMAGVPAEPEDLASHRAVIYTQGGGGNTWDFKRGAREISIALRGRIWTTAAEAVRESVLAGLGIAVSTDWMFARELKEGRVKRVLKDWALPPIELWAVFPSGHRISAKARAFVDFVAALDSGKFTS